MNEYVPTTDEICHEYAKGCGEYRDIAQEWFARWLSSVRAEAWDEGWLSSVATPPDPCWMDLDDNPYRAKENRQ